MSRNFFITGTDTEIGKTFAACALMEAMRARGLAVAPMKPIAAGTVERDGVTMNEDVHALMAVYGAPLDAALVNPYCFREPIAPHIAAVREGVDIDLEHIRRAFAILEAGHDVVLVEGAGGFLVPMNESRSLTVLPETLSLDVILIVGMRLGCLNHALLTAEAIRHRGMTLAGWVANTVDAGMSAFAENLDTLGRVMAVPCLGVIPRIAATDPVAAAREAATFLDVDSLFG